MNKIKAAIIEDEVPAARLLHEMIQSLRPDWEVMILPGTIEESVEWFHVNPHPELLFLDIQLTDGNSFMLIEQARPDSMIVFTTAYDEYAVRAFAVNSIDYLLKPIHQERLLQTIERFESLTEKYIRDFNRESRILEVLESLSDTQKLPVVENKKYRTRFLISSGNKLFTLSVVSVYHPSGTSGDERQAFKMGWLEDFQKYVMELQKSRPNLILCGDYNICHEPIDIHDPVRNATNSGFLPEEREWMTRFLSAGYVDSFRTLCPEKQEYTWWSYRFNSRAKNKGWRIDYCMVSEPVRPLLKRAYILNEAVHSDHCPMALEIL